MAGEPSGGVPRYRIRAAGFLLAVWGVLNMADVWVDGYALGDQTSFLILLAAGAFLGIEVRDAWRRRNGDDA